MYRYFFSIYKWRYQLIAGDAWNGICGMCVERNLICLVQLHRATFSVFCDNSESQKLWNGEDKWEREWMGAEGSFPLLLVAAIYGKCFYSNSTHVLIIDTYSESLENVSGSTNVKVKWHSCMQCIAYLCGARHAVDCFDALTSEFCAYITNLICIATLMPRSKHYTYHTSPVLHMCFVVSGPRWPLPIFTGPIMHCNVSVMHYM